MNSELKRMIILDNYKQPFNKKTNESYDKVRAKTASCIDDLTLYIKLEDGTIKDASFDGEACAISTASTSILIKKIIGKNVEEVKSLIEEYLKMVYEKEYDEAGLSELLAFQDIGKQPNRITCATLSFNSLRDYLDDKRNN